eukprot:TRINITY_DN12484_c0_g1_i1.p1 TRINITY_DN12484_c0_g1~~TRINITY_DN12484_c0_g1_i1.p1  ORF type:complete len:383 (-),score=89.96 TRINITY_DN12484_c0_g1_i1:20-1168(-)
MTKITVFGKVEWAKKLLNEKGELISRSDSYWADRQHQRDFFERIAKKLEVKHWEDWYDVDKKEIATHGGHSVLRYHNSSLSKALMTAYPEHSWKVWRFRRLDPGFWANKSNQEDFISDLQKQLGVTHWEEWYKFDEADVRKYGGSGLLGLYRNSYVELVTKFFPQHPWKPYHFLKKPVPNGYWTNSVNRKTFLEEFAKKYSLKKLDDWFYITHAHINEEGGAGLMYQNGGLLEALKAAYPHFNWQKPSVTAGSPSRSQLQLFSSLQRIFRREDLFVDYDYTQLVDQMKSAAVATSLIKTEVDVAIPTLKLAFEYQGQQHYTDKRKFGSASKIQKNDSDKRTLCDLAGITLVEVPFWWNKEDSSLVAAILKRRPDLTEEVKFH